MKPSSVRGSYGRSEDQAPQRCPCGAGYNEPHVDRGPGFTHNVVPPSASESAKCLACGKVPTYLANPEYYPNIEPHCGCPNPLYWKQYEPCPNCGGAKGINWSADECKIGHNFEAPRSSVKVEPSAPVAESKTEPTPDPDKVIGSVYVHGCMRNFKVSDLLPEARKQFEAGSQLPKVVEALRELVAWKGSEIVMGWFTMAHIHGSRVTPEYTAEHEKMMRRVYEALNYCVDCGEPEQNHNDTKCPRRYPTEAALSSLADGKEGKI